LPLPLLFEHSIQTIRFGGAHSSSVGCGSGSGSSIAVSSSLEFQVPKILLNWAFDLIVLLYFSSDLIELWIALRNSTHSKSYQLIQLAVNYKQLFCPDSFEFLAILAFCTHVFDPKLDLARLEFDYWGQLCFKHLPLLI